MPRERHCVGALGAGMPWRQLKLRRGSLLMRKSNSPAMGSHPNQSCAHDSGIRRDCVRCATRPGTTSLSGPVPGTGRTILLPNRAVTVGAIEAPW